MQVFEQQQLTFSNANCLIHQRIQSRKINQSIRPLRVNAYDTVGRQNQNSSLTYPAKQSKVEKITADDAQIAPILICNTAIKQLREARKIQSKVHKRK